MSTSKYKIPLTLSHIIVLIVAIVAAYSKIFHSGFITWDDNEYVVHNRDIGGIGFEHMAAWCSRFYIGNYHPLTMFSYAIDHLLGGQSPLVYHLDNLLLHASNAILLYLLINRLQSHKSIGLFVALIFSLHPVQTESVSWIAERKTVLCTLFYLLALLQYINYVKVPSTKRLLIVYIFSILAMLSKGAAVALPLSLFAVDIWLQRDFKQRRVWLEKLTLLAISIIIGIIAIKAQGSEKLLGMHSVNNVFTTIAFAGEAYVQYIARLFVPVRLSVIYPYPQEATWLQYCELACAICIIALAIIAFRKKWYFLCGGIVFYTVNIALVLQFVQFGECLMADRYLYIAGIGIIFPAVYYGYLWLQKFSSQMVATIIGGAVSALLLVLTFLRNDIWLSDLNFFSAIVETFPRSAVAQYSLGGLYVRMGEYDVAETHIDLAIEYEPDNYKAWYNKGVLSSRQGKSLVALDAFNKCIALTDYTKAYFSRAMLYEGMHKPDMAIADIDKVLQEQPQNGRAYYIKGDCLEQQNNARGAIENYSKAILYEENESLFYIRRGLAYAKNHEMQPALNDLDKAIALKPDNGEAYYYRGLVNYGMGKSPCHDLSKALQYGYKQAQEAITKYCGKGD